MGCKSAQFLIIPTWVQFSRRDCYIRPMIWTWRLENLKIVKFNFHFRYISAVSIRHIVSSGNLSSTDTTILITLSGISDISELKVRVTYLKTWASWTISFNMAKWPPLKWYTRKFIISPDPGFPGLSWGVTCFVQSISSRNHLLNGWNSSICIKSKNSYIKPLPINCWTNEMQPSLTPFFESWNDSRLTT